MSSMDKSILVDKQEIASKLYPAQFVANKDGEKYIWNPKDPIFNRAKPVEPSEYKDDLNCVFCKKSFASYWRGHKKLFCDYCGCRTCTECLRDKQFEVADIEHNGQFRNG